MFDRYYCEVPLPDGHKPEGEMQGKNLALQLYDYKITKDGGLLERQWKSDWAPMDFTGWFVFYDYGDNASGRDDHFYKATFDKGALVSIDAISELESDQVAYESHL